jgi:hypothetical protein
MPQVIFLSIVFYLAYRLIFDLIVPIFKTTRHVRRQFNSMNEQMRQQQANAYQQKERSPDPKKQSAASSKMDDYIDFEEVKP